MSEAREPDQGRRCSAPDCPTVLSRYNSDHLCFAHADEVTRRRFEQRAPLEGRAVPYRQRLDIPRIVPAAASAPAV